MPNNTVFHGGQQKHPNNLLSNNELRSIVFNFKRNTPTQTSKKSRTKTSKKKNTLTTTAKIKKIPTKTARTASKKFTGQSYRKIQPSTKMPTATLLYTIGEAQEQKRRSVPRPA